MHFAVIFVMCVTGLRFYYVLVDILTQSYQNALRQAIVSSTFSFVKNRSCVWHNLVVVKWRHHTSALLFITFWEHIFGRDSTNFCYIPAQVLATSQHQETGEWSPVPRTFAADRWSRWPCSTTPFFEVHCRAAVHYRTKRRAGVSHLNCRS